MNVAAVVVTYNRKDLLILCIAALKQQTLPLECIYVIDNDSTDGTDECISSIPVDNIPLVYKKLSENIGGAGGFHYGINQAFKDNFAWIWIMDDDAIPKADALELMCNASKKNPEIKCLAPMVHDATGKVDLSHRGLIQKGLFGELSHVDLSNTLVDYQLVDFCSFVGPLISRDVVLQVGLPNPHFFIHHDDFEYSIRLKRLGFKFLLIRDSKIIHLQASQLSNKIQRFWFEMDEPCSNKKLFLKYFSPRNNIYLNITHSSITAAIFLALKLFLKEVFRESFAINRSRGRVMFFFNAVFDGLTGKLGHERAKAQWEKAVKKGANS